MKNNKTKFGLASISMFAVALIIPMTASAALYRELQLGMRGVDVGDLQTFLARDTTIYPSGLVTGYFGTMTKSGVMRFQARNGISTVGRVGPQTMAVINAQMDGGTAGMNNMIFAGFTGLSVNPSNNSAVFTINSDMPVKAMVHYSTMPIPASEIESQGTVTIGGTQAPYSDIMQTTNYVTAGSLQSNTSYYYIVHIVNATGKSSVLFGRFVTAN